MNEGSVINNIILLSDLLVPALHLIRYLGYYSYLLVHVEPSQLIQALAKATYLCPNLRDVLPLTLKLSYRHPIRLKLYFGVLQNELLR